jgi:hypothetical protein
MVGITFSSTASVGLVEGWHHLGPRRSLLLDVADDNANDAFRAVGGSTAGVLRRYVPRQLLYNATEQTPTLYHMQATAAHCMYGGLMKRCRDAGAA